MKQPRHYYNEFDKYAAAWLRNLIALGFLPAGDVDERSIEDVTPNDLIGYVQCHFFAGIGVWPYALRRAGVRDDEPGWTASCPCQPFSAAGQGAGFDDERHLWPALFHLISVCRPRKIRGEQVASKDADPWLDLVQTDLEALGYAFGAVAFPAAGIGAPHIRDRTYWLADADGARFAVSRGAGFDSGRQPRAHYVVGGETSWLADAYRGAGGQGSPDVRGWLAGGDAQSWAGPGRGDLLIGMADADQHGRGAQPLAGIHHAQYNAQPCGGPGRLGYALGAAGEWNAGSIPGAQTEVDRKGKFNGGIAVGLEHASASLGSGLPGPTNGYWADADWLGCRDGKWRPVEPGASPLATGVANRVGRLRAYGNALNAEAAVAFILATR